MRLLQVRAVPGPPPGIEILPTGTGVGAVIVQANIPVGAVSLAPPVQLYVTKNFHAEL